MDMSTAMSGSALVRSTVPEVSMVIVLPGLRLAWVMA